MSDREKWKNLFLFGGENQGFKIVNCKKEGVKVKLIIKNSDIPDGYIAIFHGGEGERTYETYIYKIDNGHANMGFKYINVTSTKESLGSCK